MTARGPSSDVKNNSDTSPTSTTTLQAQIGPIQRGTLRIGRKIRLRRPWDDIKGTTSSRGARRQRRCCEQLRHFRVSNIQRLFGGSAVASIAMTEAELNYVKQRPRGGSAASAQHGDVAVRLVGLGTRITHARGNRSRGAG